MKRRVVCTEISQNKAALLQGAGSDAVDGFSTGT
jgi:hypothetical protein